jgi:hypothetical protein
MSDPESIGGSGYTLDDLSDYLDRGREPAIPAIDTNAECQAMLATLERVSSLSRELVTQDARENPTLDENWLAALVATIGRELRAGRDVPLTSADPSTNLAITEGAIRELIRTTGDSVEGVLVGSCSLDGDVTDPNAEITVRVSISVIAGSSVVELADHLRERVHSELLRHTQLNVVAIDVTVVDVHEITNLPGEEKQ